MKSYLLRIVEEPPFRLLVKALIRAAPVSVRSKAKWDAVDRPQYLFGILSAAQQAIIEGVPAVSVIEFGVAGGKGLLALQEYAEQVEKATGVEIFVYGFDSATGLPNFCGDYRDHPDQWKPGDYPMDRQALQKRLNSKSRLILGDIAQTVQEFVKDIQKAPVGFVSIDVDIYSSARDALQVFNLPGKRMLRHVPVYLDDILFMFSHKYAGELHAIEEFNQLQEMVKLDMWHGIECNRPFPENPWLKRFYVAHDLEAISHANLDRQQAKLSL